MTEPEIRIAEKIGGLLLIIGIILVIAANV